MGLDFRFDGCEIETPRWSYSGFMAFRQRLASCLGFNDLRRWYHREVDLPDNVRKSDLFPLLNHSDCDGDMTPDECAKVGPCLREIVGRWTDEELSDEGYDKVMALRLADCMDECAKRGVKLEFC